MEVLFNVHIRHVSVQIGQFLKSNSDGKRSSSGSHHDLSYWGPENLQAKTLTVENAMLGNSTYLIM